MPIKLTLIYIYFFVVIQAKTEQYKKKEDMTVCRIFWLKEA